MLVTLREVLNRAYRRFAPPPKLGSEEWANTYRWLAQEQSAIPGKYRSHITPWVKFMLRALDDPKTWKVVCKKSAQVAWTDGVGNNYIGRRIHLDPCAIIILFPKEKTIRRFLDQKFVPMVESSPVLRDLVDTSTSRSTGNRQDFKRFPGGFLSLVASNAPDNVKSQSAPVVIVEEPDDCSQNVSGQGDAIELLIERTKTFANRKVILGGTPTIAGVSTIDVEYENSDRGKFWVPCHECAEFHVLSFEYLTWHDDDPNTARYSCPHCGCVWDDLQKNRNVRKLDYRTERKTDGVAGFYINELYSPFPGSKFKFLAERKIKAQKALARGDDSDMIVFRNSAEGLAYQIDSDTPSLDVLRDRALEYGEKTVPRGGLILTAGVDVQHDRLAIVIRAWGRGEESWLVYWGEIFGDCTQKVDPVWDEMDSILFGAYRHESGASLRIRAASFDSSDGKSNDAVYHYVRSRNRKGLMAVKGASQNTQDREIYSKPKALDESREAKEKTKAQRYDLQIYQVSTIKAKDLIFSRLKFDGDGPARMHTYRDVRGDYYEQVADSEVKVPHRTSKGKFIYQKKSGVRNEALDCEVYALHASRYLKVHLMRNDAWDAVEKQILQSDMFSEASTKPAEPSAAQQTKAPAPAGPKSRVLSRGID